MIDEIVNFLGSEKWARVLGSLVAIITLLGAAYAVVRKMTKKPLKQEGSQKVSPVQQIWNSLEPDLQDAFIVANNERRRLKKETLQTRYLFQAFVKLENPDFLKITMAFPAGALPNSAQAERGEENTVLLDNPSLSACVTESVNSFLHTPRKRNINPADMFFDIGQYGHGSSVERLRDHGVDSKRLEEIVKAEDIDVIRRKQAA